MTSWGCAIIPYSIQNVSSLLCNKLSAYLNNFQFSSSLHGTLLFFNFLRAVFSLSSVIGSVYSLLDCGWITISDCLLHRSWK
jgi:hypothetical protein